MLVILRPGLRVFAPEALIPLVAALMFALYGLLTRRAATLDSAETSFFWTGVAGAVAITLVAPFWWTPIEGAFDLAMMAMLCVMGATGHFLLIKVYEVAEAGVVQPFSYFQLVFVTILAMNLFGERPDRWTVIGAAIILRPASTRSSAKPPSAAPAARSPPTRIALLRLSPLRPHGPARRGPERRDARRLFGAFGTKRARREARAFEGGEAAIGKALRLRGKRGRFRRTGDRGDRRTSGGDVGRRRSMGVEKSG